MDDRYAIQLARTEIRDGYDSGDADRILNQFADDFGDMSSGQPSFSGQEAKAVQRAGLEAMFALYQVRCAPASMEILLFGDTAIDCGWQELTLSPHAGGCNLVRRMRYVSLWKRKAGIWRIALWIDNPDQPPLLAEDAVALIRRGADWAAQPDPRPGELQAGDREGGEAADANPQAGERPHTSRVSPPSGVIAQLGRQPPQQPFAES